MDPETQNDDIAAVTALDLLLGHATEQVVPNMATKGDPYERAILVALFARSVPLTEAISQLGKDGFGREALMLNRPLFELMLDAYWTHANLKLATERFLQHARFAKHLLGETSVKYPEFFADLGRPEQLSDPELKQLKKIFGDFGQKSWTGLSARALVISIQEQLDDAGNRRAHVAPRGPRSLSTANSQPDRKDGGPAHCAQLLHDPTRHTIMDGATSKRAQ